MNQFTSKLLMQCLLGWKLFWRGVLAFFSLPLKALLLIMKTHCVKRNHLLMKEIIKRKGADHPLILSLNLFLIFSIIPMAFQQLRPKKLLPLISMITCPNLFGWSSDGCGSKGTDFCLAVEPLSWQGARIMIFYKRLSRHFVSLRKYESLLDSLAPSSQLVDARISKPSL